ncbi:hypothetical protein D3C75_816230 [compost metagenome]
MLKSDFSKWLQENTSLSLNSIEKYTRAIHKNSEELKKHNILEYESLFEIKDPVIIEKMKTQYLSISELREKDDRGNRMYSSAFNYLKQFVNANNIWSYVQELKKQEIEYEETVLKLHPTSKQDLVDKKQEKPTFKTFNQYKLWARNPKLAAETVAAANYLCEVDNNHVHFTSKFNNQNYVEAHHIIPIQFQDRYEFSLDVYANIISLCLVCHKILHYGCFDDKKVLLDKLYYIRQNRLRESGISLTLDALYEYYKD